MDRVVPSELSNPESGSAGGVRDHAVTTAELIEILDHLPGMVALWGADGRNVFGNEAYVEWFGVSPGALRGMHLAELLGPELYALNRTYIEGALAGEPQLFERTLVDTHGQTRYVQANYVPRVLDGEPAGFFVMINDISTRVRSEHSLQESVRQVALLEERQRIAADLHDFVIQRLFGAGLDLAAVLRAGAGSAEASWPRVLSAAEGIDDGIRELRKAIHSLRDLMTPTQVPASVERIIGNAGRALGFVPTVTYTGSLDVVPPEVVQELLAVLTEALSNVARHAAASDVRVTLACTGDQVLLQVADDGKGITSAERSSGLTNMRQRAMKLGGTFKVGENRPHGTVVEWMAPLVPTSTV